MKRNLIFRIVMFVFVFTLSTLAIDQNAGVMNITIKYSPMPLYKGIWGTIYHAEKRQCDDTPTITGDGSRINPYRASEHRWIAISQEMLNCEYRQTLVEDSTIFRGKIQYGDTIWIESPYAEINGWWIVHDTKNRRYKRSIDFLQTKGDGSLYNNDSMWCGKFEDITIFTLKDAELLGLTGTTT